MLTGIIWWTGALLQLLLLVRGVRAKWVKRFPFFYSYSLLVFLEECSLFLLYQRDPSLYATVYWVCEFIAVVFGCLVLFEIYWVTLRIYPGTARMARNLLLFVFVLACAKAIVNQSQGVAPWALRNAEELERNLRTVQAFAIIALILVILAYAIPRDRHLKGILGGYGLFVGSTVVQLSLSTHIGSSFYRLLMYIQPFSYDIVVFIWLWALWSPTTEENLSPGRPAVSGEDHSLLVSRTQHDLQSIRLRMLGAFRR
jgi:hypothetical protein